ncbi:transposase [Eggerthellaceae bacterium zg-887]|nr:transposase [Xiamenia xianingshaonis]
MVQFSLRRRPRLLKKGDGNFRSPSAHTRRTEAAPMARTPRKISEANLYHVFARGVGRQTIFEDSEDNEFFCGLMRRFVAESTGSILAWCLMGNHFHLLVKMEMKELSSFMKRLEVAYAQHFNRRHDRPGCLFQGRFGSEPIANEAQLLAAVRYIHLNPQKAGIAPFDAYEWSSFKEYAGGPDICNTRLAIDVAGGAQSFERLHREPDGESFAFMEESTDNGSARRRKLSDGDARRILEASCGAGWKERLASCEKHERDAVLARLKESGATVRQISRLTGIGRGIVQKAKAAGPR